MSMLLVHELHEARDRILLLKQRLVDARKNELPEYTGFLDENIEALDEALDQAQIPEHYRVAVVGRFKVGKSKFVNKLAGERLAGVHTNPETAAISIFRYDDKARAEVSLMSKEEWDRLAKDHADDPKNPEVKRYDRFINFNERPPKKSKDGKETQREKLDLEALTETWLIPGGKTHMVEAEDWDTEKGKKAFLSKIRKFTSSQEPLQYLVNKLTIYAPISILRDQIELIDTPGLDDTERFRVLLTENLVKNVDAILFLTESGASYSNSDKEFIVRQLRMHQIKHLQLIVTKSDVTYANAVQDAEDNDEAPPTFNDFKKQEINRVRQEVNTTLNELLSASQLSDEEGYYFIEQLDNLSVHLISAKYHDDNEIEKGGIEAVRSALYGILSSSHRFGQAKTVLQDRLSIALERLRRQFSERLNTLEREFDPAKVRSEIEAIRGSLSKSLDILAESSGEALRLLKGEQEAFFHIMPTHLDLVSMQAKEVLGDLEKADLIKHWKTRRHGYWGFLTDLQSKIADRVFPKVESILNGLGKHLDSFMESSSQHLKQLQKGMSVIESQCNLSGLDPLDLAGTQKPAFERSKTEFARIVKSEKDAIVTNMDDFVTQEVQSRLDGTRDKVANILGRGTTIRQSEEVQSFYAEIRSLLASALREHLEERIRGFASYIFKTSESVTPQIRKASELAIQQRLEAIESSLQIAATGQKEIMEAYLSSMIAVLSDFAAEPNATVSQITKEPRQLSSITGEPAIEEPDKNRVPAVILQEQHYEIDEGAIGYTYERIFRPYIDSAENIQIEDPYIRLPYQVYNLLRFCALAVRLGAVKSIKLITAELYDEKKDDVDSRLETLRRDLENRGIDFIWNRDPNIHDRETKFDNGWSVKIGRGLDIYQKPETWLSVEAADFSLRPCRQTKIDVFRIDGKMPD